jgi:hypothetical protein
MTDGHRSAKADAKAEKARAKAMRPWWKKKRFIIPLALVAVAIIASVGSSGGGTNDDSSANAGASSDAAKSNFSSNDEHRPVDDVKLVSCTKTVIDTVEAELEVTNHSSKESNYTITLSIEDGSGAKVGDGFASTNNVDAGQVAHVKGVASLDTAAPSFTCKIENVERYAS